MRREEEKGPRAVHSVARGFTTAWVVGALVAIFAFTPAVEAQCQFVLDEVIDLPGGGPRTGYTDAVTVEGDVAVIATERVATGGELIVYRRTCDSWAFEQNLRPSVEVRASFGYSVGVSGNTILFGCSDSNSVFVFRYRDGLWIEDQILTFALARLILLFGHSISMDGDMAVIGAPGNFFSSGPPLNPAILIFRLVDDQWVEEAAFYARGADLFSGFGMSVAASGDRVAVGRPLSSGPVSLYRTNGRGWFAERNVLAPEPRSLRAFGVSLSLDEDSLLVGSPAYSYLNGGAAYYFRITTGGTVADQQELLPAEQSPSFGASVSIDRGTAVIGDDGVFVNPDGFSAGRVISFQESDQTWSQTQVLTFGRADDLFGHTIDFSERALIVGERGDESGRIGRLFTLTECGRDPAPESVNVGSVNAGIGSPKDVLFLNGSSGGVSRVVEYNVRGPLELSMELPPSMTSPQRAPFALYLWPGRLPNRINLQTLPFGVGCAALPMPILGGDPQPVIIWNNAKRFRFLGVPTRPSEPAPTRLIHRPMGLARVGRFFVQGIIFDPGSAGDVTASVTNGIVAVPVFR